MRQIDATTASARSIPTDTMARTIAGGRASRAEVARRLAPYVARSQSRDRLLVSRRGWLSEAERQNSWQGAEVCGEPTPEGFQSWLSRAAWDADVVRDERCSDSLQPLGDRHGVLVLDATGLLKKGQYSAGVARQYSGPAGKVDHCQLGVLLSYASPLGQVLLDRERYLPQPWTDGRERCRPAGMPEDRRGATTPQLAQHLGALGTAGRGIIAHCGAGWRPTHRPLS